MNTQKDENKTDFSLFDLKFNEEEEPETPAASTEGAAGTGTQAASATGGASAGTADDEGDDADDNAAAGDDNPDAAATAGAAGNNAGAGAPPAGDGGEGTEDESDISYTPYAKAMFAMNGWQWDDKLMAEDNLESFDALIKNIVDVNKNMAVEAAFANPQTRKFNELVAAGASPEQAYNVLFNQIDYNKLDLKDQKNQEEVVRRHLQATTKFSTERIEKEIKRYADLNELEDMAKEGLVYLKEAEGKKEEALRAELENHKTTQIEQKKQSIEKKKTEIRTIKKLAGFDITPEEAETFIDFVFTPDQNSGMTPYQEYVQKNPNWELEAAYGLFKGLNKETLSRRTATEATKIIKEAMAAKKKAGVAGGQPAASPNRVTPNPKNPEVKEKIDYNDFLL